MKKNFGSDPDHPSGSRDNEPPLVPKRGAKSWLVFWALFAEWLTLGLEERYNNSYLEAFKFSDEGIEFSERAGVQARVWLDTPGV